MIQGENKPAWLERRIAAINKADGKPEVVSVGAKVEDPATDKAQDATTGKAGTDTDVNVDQDGVPSWKAKLIAAKKTLLAEDGEQRPKWLEKRIHLGRLSISDRSFIFF